MNKDVEIEEGSGNIFSDLGYHDPEISLLKSRLAQRIAELIERQGVSRAKAADLLGVDQPKVSKLLRGQLKDFSTDRLFRFLNALNQDIEIVIKPKSDRDKVAEIRILAA
jgi:predicted XRE-type DNA-binding protein